MALHEAILFTPLALGLMAVEYGVARHQGREVYHFSRMIGDLSCSLGNLVAMGALGLSGLTAYGWLAEGVGLLPFRVDVAWHWVVAFLVADLVFWLRHWMSHRVAFLWAIHGVHHQGHDFNLGTAQRSPWLHSLQSAPFVALLAAIGVPLEMAGVFYLATFVWQFFCHTEVVHRLGPVEWLFVTPSHHRVHHACNGRYLDRNHGGILIVWDRLFGTFEDEREAPVYGTVHPVGTHDALQANTALWREIAVKMRGAPSWGRALQVPFRPPGWDPRTGLEPVAVLAADREAPPEVAPERRVEVGLAFAAALVAVLVVLQAGPAIPTAVGLVLAAGLWAAIGVISEVRGTSEAVAER